jgi:hypothetical protein
MTLFFFGLVEMTHIHDWCKSLCYPRVGFGVVTA